MEVFTQNFYYVIHLHVLFPFCYASWCQDWPIIKGIFPSLDSNY